MPLNRKFLLGTSKGRVKILKHKTSSRKHMYPCIFGGGDGVGGGGDGGGEGVGWGRTLMHEVKVQNKLERDSKLVSTI